MLNLKDITIRNTKEFIEEAINAADSFGFSNLDNILNKLPSKRLKAANKVIHANPREKNFLKTVRKLATKNTQKTKEHILGYSINKNKESESTFTLNVAGTNNPISEATIIATAYTLLDNIGIPDTTVHINSLGTHESFTRYIRDLTKYLKKISKDTPLQVRADLAISPLRAYARLCNNNKDLAKGCPQAIDYLNDDGRSHLWGLLEYLEGARIPYVLDNTVTGSGDFFEHTMFEIWDDKKDNLIAYGGRHNVLSRKAFNKNIPITTLSIDINGNVNKFKQIKEDKNPTFYFAQLGNNAKKLGLKVLRDLHNAGIKVKHTITHKELTKQMSNPLAKQVPFVIIIGQKEALTDSVIVRDTATHKQKVVPTKQLVRYLKKLQR